MKKIYVISLLIVFIIGMAFIPVFAVDFLDRCAFDNLDNPKATGRFEWCKKCVEQSLINYHDKMYGLVNDPVETKLNRVRSEWFYVPYTNPPKLRPRIRHPTYGLLNVGKDQDHNPKKWYAGTAANEPCKALPTGYEICAICTASCYHPDTLILFENHEIPIKKGYENIETNVMTVSDDSTLDTVELISRPVKSYTISFKDAEHEIVELTMESGKVLRVTLNHPLINQNGVMVKAGLLEIGNSLITYDGEKDLIVDLKKKIYFGKVYNLAPESSSLLGHILIAEGYLSGSSWYQNDGANNINRIILRRNIPDELFEDL